MNVSVIIPTYNYGHYISRALDSILQQDYDQKFIEVIVVDDGSTDDTEDVVASYKVLFQKLEYIKTINNGKAAATYLGFQHCTGDVVFNLDADDYFFSNKIAKVVSIYKSFPFVSHVGHPAAIASKGYLTGRQEELPKDILNKEISGNQLLSFFLINNIIWGGGSTYSVRKVADFLPQNTFLCDMYIDEYLVYRALSFGNSYFLPDSLSCWNVHQQNYSIDRRLDSEKILRLERSAKGLLELLISESFSISFFYKIKYLCIKAHNAQISNSYVEWAKAVYNLCGALIVLLSKYPRKFIKVSRSYNILNRLFPPLIYNNIKSI